MPRKDTITVRPPIPGKHIDCDLCGPYRNYSHEAVIPVALNAKRKTLHFGSSCFFDELVPRLRSKLGLPTRSYSARAATKFGYFIVDSSKTLREAGKTKGLSINERAEFARNPENWIIEDITGNQVLDTIAEIQAEKDIKISQK